MIELPGRLPRRLAEAPRRGCTMVDMRNDWTRAIADAAAGALPAHAALPPDHERPMP